MLRSDTWKRDTCPPAGSKTIEDLRLRWIFHLRLSTHERLVTNFGVHNLSRFEFSDVQRYLLGLGSRFQVTSSIADHNNFSTDLARFERRVHWKEAIEEGPHGPPQQKRSIKKFHIASKRLPPSAFPGTELKRFELRSEATALRDTCKPRRRNTTRAQPDIVLSLRQDPPIIVRDADKNLGTAILNSDEFAAEAARQLADTSPYRIVCPVGRDTALNPELEAIETELTRIISSHNVTRRDVEALLWEFPFQASQVSAHSQNPQAPWALWS